MFARKPSRRWGITTATERTFAALSIGATSLLSGCDNPGEPRPPGQTENSAYHGIYDPGSGTLEFQLESPTGGPSPFRLVATNLSQDPETRQVHAWVALRNTSGETLQGPPGIIVGDFVPEDVRPVNASCSGPCPLSPCPPDTVCPPCPPPCAFDHGGTYGEDGLLAPDETSEPVEWILANPSGESFAFTARLEVGLHELGAGEISGVVFHDRNDDGRRQDDEPGIPGSTVSLLSGGTAQATETDAGGRYAFHVSEPGLYEIVWDPGRCPPSTPTRLQVLILQRPDGSLSGFGQGDFGCFAEGDVVGINVGGIVYVDTNRNGQHDPGETGIPRIRVTGYTPNCPTFGPIEAHTDERGRYFMRLPLCDFPVVVQREPVPGYFDTSRNPVMIDQPPDDPSVTLVANFGVAPLDSTRVEFLLEWGSKGNGNGQFVGPYGIATDASGNVYVTDYGNHRVQKFTSDGVFLAAWGSFGSGEGEFTGPSGIAVDSHGDIFVADIDLSRVQKFASDGRYVATISSLDGGAGAVGNPQGLAVDGQGNLYVSNGDHRALKFSNDGTFAGAWGQYGHGDGEFHEPRGVAADAAGNVYVVDFDSRVQVFTGDGVLLRRFDILYAGHPTFQRWENPASIAVGNDGQIFVATYLHHQLQVFTPDARRLSVLSGSGTRPGQFNNPSGVAVDGDGNVYLVDQGNNRIQKFRVRSRDASGAPFD